MSESTLIDPDDYRPGTFRDVAEDLLEALHDAIDTEGLNAGERGTLIQLRNHALGALHFREAVPDTFPATWLGQAIASPERNRAWAREAASRWRGMSDEDRHDLVLDAMDDEAWTVLELILRLRSRRDDLYFTPDKIRQVLRQMMRVGLAQPVDGEALLELPTELRSVAAKWYCATERGLARLAAQPAVSS